MGEQIRVARPTKPLIKLILYLRAENESHRVYCQVKVGFLYIDVSNVVSGCSVTSGSFLCTATSKNGKVRSFSWSREKTITGCRLFRSSKNFELCSSSKRSENVSSTYLLFKSSSSRSLMFSFYSRYPKKIFASTGPRGEPIATPSVCLNITPSKLVSAPTLVYRTTHTYKFV